MGLLFEGSVAAQKLNSARLQRLHAGVLIRRVRIIGVLRRTSLTGPSLREIVDITNGGLSRGRIRHIEPLSYLVLCPDSVVVIDHVGGPVQRNGNLDLPLRNVEAKAQSVQRVFDVVEKFSLIDMCHVVDLLDVGAVFDEFAKILYLPLRTFPDKLGRFRRSGLAERVESGDPGHGLGNKRSTSEWVHLYSPEKGCDRSDVDGLRTERPGSRERDAWDARSVRGRNVKSFAK